jgi:hypothetical protein
MQVVAAGKQVFHASHDSAQGDLVMPDFFVRDPFIACRMIHKPVSNKSQRV